MGKPGVLPLCLSILTAPGCSIGVSTYFILGGLTLPTSILTSIGSSKFFISVRKIVFFKSFR
jgi:hypothetical protein